MKSLIFVGESPSGRWAFFDPKIPSLQPIRLLTKNFDPFNIITEKKSIPTYEVYRLNHTRIK
jgi:hypothetical protein